MADPAPVAPEPPAAALEDPAPEPPAAAAPEPPAVAWRIVAVHSVTLELPEQYPVVTLTETGPPGRSLSLRVGLSEGVSLRHALEATSAPRPLTHDLFTACLRRLSVEVTAVRLIGRRGTLWSAELELMTPRGREVLACRPSDGLGLALRQRPVAAPVLADDRLFSPGDVG